MDFLREHQLDLMLALAFCCGLLSLFSFLQTSTSRKRKYSLLSISLWAMIMLLSDRWAYIYRGNTTQFGFFMTRVTNFLTFFMLLLIVFSFNKYLEDFFEKGQKLTFKRLTFTKIVCYSSMILLVISQFTNFYYYFDEQNLYHRNVGYAFGFIFPFCILLTQLSVIIQNGRKISKRMFVPLLFFGIIPVIAAVLQLFFYGLSLINISIVGMVILLRVFAVIESNEILVDSHKKEVKLLKEKNEIAHSFVFQTSEALASAIDAKDEYTNGHSMRVSQYSVMIAKRFGKSEEECEKIRMIALLHDVGKIGVPSAIINKNGKLTDEEYSIVKKHTVKGYEILSNIKDFPELSIGAHYHHERYDGMGYPEGLKGNDIPEIARIIAVADAYDAMASKRSYRGVLIQEDVRLQILKGIGTQFDPKFALIMVDLIDEDKEYKMRQID